MPDKIFCRRGDYLLGKEMIWRKHLNNIKNRYLNC